MAQSQYPQYPHPPPYSTDPQVPQYQQPPPMHMAPPVLQQPVHVVHIQNSAVGPVPSMVVCSSCHQNVLTRLEHESTMRTHLAAVLLCVLGCWPCVCLPYCVDSCQNANHYCPACGSFIATYQN